MLSLAIGEYILAYNVGKVLIDVGQIGVLAFIDKGQAKQKLDDYLEPIFQTIKAIEKEEISLRDTIKGAIQCATGFYAQSKLLSGLGKFYKGIQTKAHSFIAKNPALDPEHYLATPEGFLFKSVANSEARNPSKHIPVKISQREIILPKVKTYEQARNKGLKLLGALIIILETSNREIWVCKGDKLWVEVVWEKVSMRIDYDPTKGPHINITDSRIVSKNGKGISVAIPFEGDKQLVKSLLRTLNTSATLKAAKIVFEQTKDNENLDIILKLLEGN